MYLCSLLGYGMRICTCVYVYMYISIYVRGPGAEGFVHSGLLFKVQGFGGLRANKGPVSLPLHP